MQARSPLKPNGSPLPQGVLTLRTTDDVHDEDILHHDTSRIGTFCVNAEYNKLAQACQGF